MKKTWDNDEKSFKTIKTFNKKLIGKFSYIINRTLNDELDGSPQYITLVQHKVNHLTVKIKE